MESASQRWHLFLAENQGINELKVIIKYFSQISTKAGVILLLETTQESLTVSGEVDSTVWKLLTQLSLHVGENKLAEWTAWNCPLLTPSPVLVHDSKLSHDPLKWPSYWKKDFRAETKRVNSSGKHFLEE